MTDNPHPGWSRKEPKAEDFVTALEKFGQMTEEFEVTLAVCEMCDSLPGPVNVAYNDALAKDLIEYIEHPGDDEIVGLILPHWRGSTAAKFIVPGRDGSWFNPIRPVAQQWLKELRRENDADYQKKMAEKK